MNRNAENVFQTSTNIRTIFYPTGSTNVVANALLFLRHQATATIARARLIGKFAAIETYVQLNVTETKCSFIIWSQWYDNN